MSKSKINHNYMSIPKYERPFTVAGTYVASSYTDNNGTTEKWYSLTVSEDAQIGEIVFEDITIDYTDFDFSVNDRTILGNILSFELLAGSAKASRYWG